MAHIHDGYTATIHIDNFLCIFFCRIQYPAKPHLAIRHLVYVPLHLGFDQLRAVWGKMPAYRQCRQDLDSIPSAAQRLIKPPIHFSSYLPLLELCITKRLCYGKQNVPLLRDVISVTL